MPWWKKAMVCFRRPPNLRNIWFELDFPLKIQVKLTPRMVPMGKVDVKYALFFPPQSWILCTCTGKSHGLKCTNANCSISQVIYCLTCRQYDVQYIGLCTTEFA